MSANNSRSSSAASFAVALATVSVLAAAAWWRVKKQAPASNGSSSSKQVVDADYPPEGVSPAVLHAFEEAAERIRHVTHLSDGDKLFLYALYKQATVGDAPGSFSSAPQSSSWNVMASQAKYFAWRKLQGMPRHGAFFQYIATAQLHIDEHMSDQKTELIDNRSGEDVDDVLDDDDDDDSKPSLRGDNNHQGGGGSGMMGVAVSRPVMLSDPEDDETTETAEEDHGIEGLFLRSAAANNVELVKRLVQDHFPAALDLNHQDRMGQCALHLAADTGAIDVMEYLLSNHGQDIDVDAKDDDGSSVLQAAVIAGQVEACRLLLKYGANPDLPDDDGDTPRHCAADDGSQEMKFLFDSFPEKSSEKINGH